MSEPDPPVSDDGSRLRKDRVHMTMLIELLVAFVFIAMAYAFIQNEDKNITHLTQELKIVRAELDEAKSRIGRLMMDNKALRDDLNRCKESLYRLLKQSPDSIRANDQPVVLYKSEYDRMKARIANAEAMRDEAQKEYNKVREQLHQGGKDLPNCPVTAGFLLRVDLFADGTLRATPAWAQGAEEGVQTVDGAAQLVQAGNLSVRDFSRLSRAVSQWGRKQPTPCAFRVRIAEHHSDLDLYKAQLAAIEQFFYVKRN